MDHPQGWMGPPLIRVDMKVRSSIHPSKRVVHPFLRVDARVGRMDHPYRVDIGSSNIL